MKKKEWNEGLDHLDPDIIEKYALRKDRLRQKKKSKGIWLRLGAIAACFALIVSAIIVVPLLREDEQGGVTGSWTTDSPIINLPTNEIVFDSLDKVNFYAGLKLIYQQESTISIPKAPTYDITMLSDNDYVDYSVVLLNTDTEPKNSYLSSNDENKQNKGGHDISGEILHITTAIYFQLKVTEQDEFLASKVGVGTTDVIITDLVIGQNPYAMITFKNEERYFSCLTEHRDLQKEENRFYTHLYISGFELVKDASNGVSHFNVFYDSDLEQVTSVSWIPYSRIPSEAPVYPITIVSDSTQVIYTTYDFTLFELAEYYNGTTDIPQGNNPNQTDPSPSETQSVYVVTGADCITPVGYTIRREYYDQNAQQWAEENIDYDVCAFIAETESMIPIVYLSGEIDITIKGNGIQLEDTRVYYLGQDGNYYLYSELSCAVEKLHGMFPQGEWYVAFGVEWQDDYVSEADRYEHHCNEYIFKLIVTE